MLDDRCEDGRAICPPLGKVVLGNRSGAPFYLARHKVHGECVICGQHIDGPKMVEVRCDGSPGCLHGIRQLHAETE